MDAIASRALRIIFFAHADKSGLEFSCFGGVHSDRDGGAIWFTVRLGIRLRLSSIGTRVHKATAPDPAISVLPAAGAR